MEYAILLYADAALRAGPGEPEWDEAMGAHVAFSQRLTERGVRYTGAALRSADAATAVRRRDGGPLVTDGPFAETKEQLWGFYVVEVPDLDAAIELAGDVWEARHGTVEIRPVIPTGG